MHPTIRTAAAFLALSLPAVAQEGIRAPNGPSGRATLQEQSVVAKKRAKTAAAARRRGIEVAQTEARMKQQAAAEAQALREWNEYVIRMGPIWAAEHANQIQQQRNMIMARQAEIQRQAVQNQTWAIWQQQQNDQVRNQLLQQSLRGRGY